MAFFLVPIRGLNYEPPTNNKSVLRRDKNDSRINATPNVNWDQYAIEIKRLAEILRGTGMNEK